MTAPHPSILQRIASAPQNSVWVDASAGTGKTKVLTDRVLRFLLQGIPPSKILCLTFTKAAAAEMQTRIFENLSLWATCSRERLVGSLEDLLGHSPAPQETTQARVLFFDLLDDAYGLKVLTIHSFCQQILGRFPLEAGVPIKGELMDEVVEKTLLNQAGIRLIQRLSEDPSLIQAFSYMRGFYKPQAVLSAVKEIIQDPKSRRFLSTMPVQVLTQNLEKHFGFPITKTAQDCFGGFVLNRPLLQKIIQALAQGTITDEKTAESLKPFLKQEVTLETFESYFTIFYTLAGTPRQRFGTLKVLKACPDVTLFFQDQVARLEIIRQEITAWKACLGSHGLMSLAAQLLDFYGTLKAEKGALDFQDLIAKSSKLLEKDQGVSWVLYKLDGGIDHILVDEAQDTSPDQWQIILKLAEDFFAGETARAAHRTLFVVGDRKQSIYSFQGAEPDLFHHFRLYFEGKIQEAQRAFEHVSLDVSFRSCKAVLEVVDHVFQRLSVDPLQGHQSFRAQDGGSVTLWPLISSPAVEKDAEERSLYTPSAAQKLATKIAQDMRRRLDQRDFLMAKGRPVQAGDFLILLQRRGSFMYQMIRALKRLKIPVAGPDRFDLMDHLAVQDLLALGAFLLLPEDDYALACVLKSPLFGFSEDQLFAVGSNRGSLSLWASLKANDAFGESQKTLKSLLKKVDQLTPYALYHHVLTVLKGRQKFRARLSDECEDALDEFLSLAFDHSRDNQRGLQGFLDFCHTAHPQVKRDFSGVDLGAVRIMTVHGAKGLQAPIVYLPDTTRVPKKTSLLLWQEDPKNGIFPLWRMPTPEGSAHAQQARDQAQEGQMAEYYRLLYVAMTRAEDELIIAGWETTQETSDQCWYYMVEPTLHRLGNEDDQGFFVHTCPHLNPSAALRMPLEVMPSVITESPLPDWLLTNPPTEIGAPDPLSPSAAYPAVTKDTDRVQALSPLQDSLDQQLYAEGNYIHRLLEILPTLPPESWEEVALNLANSQMIANPMEGLTLVQSLLTAPDFRDLFVQESMAEVPVFGEIRGQAFKGKIDRLVFGDNTLTIIDFKSNRHIPETLADIPPSYVGQLSLYKDLLQKAYPNHTITCELIWVRALKRMPVPSSFLDAFINQIC